MDCFDERDWPLRPREYYRNPQKTFEILMYLELRGDAPAAPEDAPLRLRGDAPRSMSRDAQIALAKYCRMAAKRVFKFVSENPVLVMRLGLERFGRNGAWLRVFMWIDRELDAGREIRLPDEEYPDGLLPELRR